MNQFEIKPFTNDLLYYKIKVIVSMLLEKHPTKRNNILMDNYNNTKINISEASAILGISKATLRNWVKLGKIAPYSHNPLTFSKEEILATHRNLESSSLLKSRRNKSRINSNFIPRSYIDSASANMPVILDLVGMIQDMDIPVMRVISYYAKELMIEAGLGDSIATELIRSADMDERLSDEPAEAAGISDSKLVEILDQHPMHFFSGEDTLGMLYLSLRLIRDKKSSGSYYTPYYVVDRIIDNIFKSCDKKDSILDPACGTGNFLLRLAGIVPLEAIRGFDIDENAVVIARINLAMKYKIRTKEKLNALLTNIRSRDFLMPKEKDITGKLISDSITYDIILGNPPWGYSFSGAEAITLSYIYTTFSGGKTPESFSLFIEQGLRRLSPGGTLSFLLPESILEADMHASIREYILENAAVRSLFYLGDIFDKVQCPCVILTVEKAPCSPSHEAATDMMKETSKTCSVTDECAAKGSINVSFESLNKNALTRGRSFTASAERLSADSFHILCDDDEYRILEKIRTADCFTLKGNARFCLGIVTGSNKTMLKDSAHEGLEPILKGKDIVKFGVTQPDSYIAFAPDHFQQCAPEELYRHSEKLFYRFIAEEPIVALDCNGTLSLNSANILIPEVPGYSAAYIMAVLNSDVISFYYKKSFRSLKVLRSALESLPIPRCSKEQQAEIIQLAMALSYSEVFREKRPADFDALKESLDRKVAVLYDLTRKEYAQISSHMTNALI